MSIDPHVVSAVVFDMDGVVTDTADAHFRAWKRLFDDVLRARGEQHTDAFTREDYLASVDGRSREDGVAGFLATRGIHLPRGAENDGPDEQTVVGLGRRKNRYFLDVIRDEGVHAYRSTVALVHDLQAAGLGTALVTASRNAVSVLEAAGISGLFPVLVDGGVAADLGLAGKPDPAVFVEAARRLGATPSTTVVVEDATSGVDAGRRGGFALVVGVDRTGDGSRLREAGADVVVADLADVRLADRTAP
ncbi:MAG: HAD family hydrolase [Actinomycetes bacterium]